MFRLFELFPHVISTERFRFRSLIITFPRSVMAPTRARTAAASSSSQPATAATKLTLHGGVPHHA